MSQRSLGIKARGMRRLTAIIAGCTIASIFPCAWASIYTGTILDLKAVPSPVTAGNVRVSIEISGTTSCTSTGLGSWYSFDRPAEATESLWSAILLAALSTGNKVTITGADSCDAFGIEEVAYIDAVAP